MRKEGAECPETTVIPKTGWRRATSDVGHWGNGRGTVEGRVGDGFDALDVPDGDPHLYIFSAESLVVLHKQPDNVVRNRGDERGHALWKIDPIVVDVPLDHQTQPPGETEKDAKVLEGFHRLQHLRLYLLQQLEKLPEVLKRAGGEIAEEAFRSVKQAGDGRADGTLKGRE